MFVVDTWPLYVHRIDPALMLCNEASCQVRAEGKSLYLDDDHLSEFGSRWVSGIFRPVFGSVEESTDHSR
jgi:hypothetical protein